jgi:hypothetical protein
MRYALLTTAAAAALSLSIAQGLAQTGTSGTTNASGGTSTSASSTGSVGAVNVTSEQRTQITRAFTSVNVQPVTNVNFEVRTGTVLPANVSLHPCPRQVIDILTGIRQCEFVIVKNEIVIVEPSSRKIVTVIERRG